MIPTVSVVIPCFNAGRFLRAAIDSALGQTVPPLEVIVIDDGSTDDSAAIAESFGSPVHVIRQRNHGESHARNRGIEFARGDWIALLDADDVWTPEKTAIQLAAVASAREIPVCVFSDDYVFGIESNPHARRPDWHASPSPHVKLLCRWCVPPSTALFPRAVCRDVLFPEEVRHGEDLIFFAHLRCQGPFLKIPLPLSGYRTSDRQQTRQTSHRLASLRSRLSWAEQHRELFTHEELQEIRSFFTAEIHASESPAELR